MRIKLGRSLWVFILSVLIAALGVSTAAGQTKKKKKRTTSPAVRTLPAPSGDASVVSRADEYQILGSVPDEPTGSRVSSPADSDATTRSLDDLRDRIRALEAVRSKDPDAKEKRLSLSLDIVTRAEQRSDGLRKQLFEMIEKENTISGRLDQIEVELRPEAIDRIVNTQGSLRPEELRDMRRKSLTSEKANLQSLLTEVQRNKAAIQLNLDKADQLVEKLRSRLEKEIDAALAGDEGKPE